MRKHWKHLLVATFALGLLVAPFASAVGEGDPILGGARNPEPDQRQELTRETEIIANVNSYGTRQSNKSNNGGGAIYGCRSGAGGTPANNEPCVRANNLSQGLAFEFAFEGPVGGTIDSRVPGDERKPFTTNATGVATGLNADRVDGLEAEQLRDLFAQVAPNGTAGANRGVPANGTSRQAEGDYDVVFAGDRTACAFTATTNGTNFGVVTATPGAVAGGNTTVDVRTFNANGNPADRPFHITVSC